MNSDKTMIVIMELGKWMWFHKRDEKGLLDISPKYSLIQFVLCVHNNCSLVLHLQYSLLWNKEGLKVKSNVIYAVTFNELICKSHGYYQCW